MLRVCDAADRAIDDQVSRSSGGAPPKKLRLRKGMCGGQGEERLRFTRSPICAPAPTCAAVARGVAGIVLLEGIVVA